MIFVTVGSQMPFDRLIKMSESWAQENWNDEIIFQVGTGGYRPKKYRSVELLSPIQYKEILNETHFMISHAGMGSIISAIEFSIPIIIMPRKAKLKETRNDHQIYTAFKFSKDRGIYMADNIAEIVKAVDKINTETQVKLSYSEHSLVLTKYINVFIKDSITLM